jgi:hypothetical protein
MTEALKKDICGLKDPGVLVNYISQDLIEACVPPALRYASVYWVQHVEQSHNLLILLHDIDSFLHGHFLHWLEVLALTKRLCDGVKMIGRLGSLFVSVPP